MPIKKNEIFEGANNKILIIEDEDALASVLSSKFKLEGFEVAVGANGEEGLNKIQSFKPDLILLDIVMPKMNGYEVLESLQKSNNKIPIIVISNSGQDVELEKIKNLGAIDYIIKTQINPGEVIKKARNVLNGRAESDNQTEEKIDQEEEGGAGGTKVLLVEDDSFLRDICYKKLKKEGFNVAVAVNGEEAVKKVGEFNPAIVLLDIILPAMDGFEVLKEIRAHKNRLVKNVPVIMLTNLGQEEDNKKALALGANDYLVKAHFTTEEIINKIKSRLGL
ncbi:MAG: response regulator [Patescibacteria group bacterium]|nr:response regulator [Patescibacteria group bacterium]